MPGTSRSFNLRVQEIRDERAEGNGWFVYLQPGWQLDGAHCFGEDTKNAMWRTLRRVTRCHCAECEPTERPAGMSRANWERSQRFLVELEG